MPAARPRTRAGLRLALVLTAAAFAVVLLGAVPATADVDCADLGTRSTAQSYFESRPGDADRLDADSDGQACEAGDTADPGRWALVGLAALVAAALLGCRLVDTRRERSQELAGDRPVPAPLPLATPGATHRLVSAAPAGSLDDLAHALRLIPYAERMPLLERHARNHGTAPQEVLDALVAEVDDLALQRWALAGYDSPASVRLMYCACVGGLRNFKRRGTPEGLSTWSCATCRSSVRQAR